MLYMQVFIYKLLIQDDWELKAVTAIALNYPGY